MKLFLHKLLLCTTLLASACLVSCGEKSHETSAVPQQKPWTPSATPKIADVASTPVSWEKLEETSFNWNNRGEVKLIAEIPKPYGDAGDFTRVRIKVPGEKEFVLGNEDGWVKFNGKDSPFRFSPDTIALAKRAESILRSDSFMVLDVGKGREAILLISWGYASDASRLHVLELPKQGPPVVVFNDLLDIDEIRDFDSDGLKEIAGSPWLSESLGDSLQTYDPAHVLHFSKLVGAKLEVSIPLSKTYNEKQRFGWAGPDPSEKFLVFKPKGVKARILPADEAQRLAEAESAK